MDKRQVVSKKTFQYYSQHLNGAQALTNKNIFPEINTLVLPLHKSHNSTDCGLTKKLSNNRTACTNPVKRDSVSSLHGTLKKKRIYLSGHFFSFNESLGCCKTSTSCTRFQQTVVHHVFLRPTLPSRLKNLMPPRLPLLMAT